MDKNRKGAAVELVARETLHRDGKKIAPGESFGASRAEAEDLVGRRIAAWPEDGAAPVLEAAPLDDAAREAAIRAALRAAASESVDNEAFTPDGRPSIYWLAHRLGFPVPVAERDAALEALFDDAPEDDLFTRFADEEPQESAPHDFGDPLLNAIRDLAPGEVGNWTRDGRPSATVLSEILKRNVAAEERDAAWARFQYLQKDLAAK
ncbi:hypothetical protein [Parvibaculum sp.]|uniref:hypothetical protein n=1 Tax=Parvibaculum sp. TaxID=2024848 RepID=UPI001D305E5F|nr:hypothetical protein [Parvibaculum sp.]MBX3488872.1 hypothetical protein [Parvibaculum sp.]